MSSLTSIVIAELLPPVVIFITIILTVTAVLLLMRPRRFYLVRHGETLLNAEHIRQGEDGALSPRGREQAEKVGRYLQYFPVQSIITSTYPRAKETANIINTHLQVPITYSSLFVERRNPSEIIGKHTGDSEVIRIVDQMDLAYHEDEYRFSNEENFIDEKARARTCLANLENQSARTTVVVTHHHFLKMIVAYLLYRERLHAADYIKLAFFNVSDNAGVTVVEYHPWRMFSPTRGWEVVSYNEQPE
jgi:broad specificity phosphatase PhoE